MKCLEGGWFEVEMRARGFRAIAELLSSNLGKVSVFKTTIKRGKTAWGDAWVARSNGLVARVDVWLARGNGLVARPRVDVRVAPEGWVLLRCQRWTARYSQIRNVVFIS